MIPAAALFLSLGAAAFIGRGGRTAAVGVPAALLALLACSLEWGFALGLLVMLFLAMAAGSAVVLLLPLRPTWTRALASALTALGLAALGAGALT